MANAGLLERIAPKVWKTTWNVHSQANPNGHTSFKYLAPYVFKVAISNSRIVSLKDRTTRLDAIECIRRFLHHVLPDGFMKVRHFGFMNAHCAIPTDTICLMIVKRHPVGFKTPHVEAPSPFVASGPSCGVQMRVVMRLWTATKAFLDTG